MEKEGHGKEKTEERKSVRLVVGIRSLWGMHHTYHVEHNK